MGILCWRIVMISDVWLLGMCRIQAPGRVGFDISGGCFFSIFRDVHD